MHATTFCMHLHELFARTQLSKLITKQQINKPICMFEFESIYWFLLLFNICNKSEKLTEQPLQGNPENF